MPQPYKDWTWREGSSEPIEFQLTADDEPANLTGYQKVEIRIKPEDDNTVLSFDTVSDPTRIVVTDAATGAVTFFPLASGEFELAAAHYELFFWVTDASGKIISFPTDRNFILHVMKAH